jgi:hypothetical protein
MHIFDVIKCNHFNRQPPSSAFSPPQKLFPMWGNVGGCADSRDNAYPRRSTDVVAKHPPTYTGIHRPNTACLVVQPVKSSHILATANGCAIIYTVSP